MSDKILTYEEFKEKYNKLKKYDDDNCSCFLCGSKPAYYQGGDSRYYYPACEKCIGIKKYYEDYLKRKNPQITPYNKPKNPKIDYNKYIF